VTHSHIVAVILWMTGALLSFSTTAVAVRALAPTLGVFDMLALRSMTAVSILLALALAKPGLRPGLRLRRAPLHLIRNVVHFGATYSWTLGVTLLPLATVFALEFTAPAWVGVLAVLVLRERLSESRLIAIVAGFLGVMVILRPGLAALQPASFIVLAAAVGFAVSAVVTKQLTRTESTFSILFYMNLIQLPLNLAGVDPGFPMRLGPGDALPIAGLCLGGLLSHYCLTNAYRNGDAIMVVPMDFLRIPLIALVGWQLYGERLDPFVLLGSLSIILGILWNLRAEAAAPGAR
jgi:drug/metabolite transporter (DMT)-like permease